MNELGSLLAYLRDPKLAGHATGALPAWLWSVDATRVLWANPIEDRMRPRRRPVAEAGQQAFGGWARALPGDDHGIAGQGEDLRGNRC